MGEPLGQELDLSGDVPEWEWGSHPKWLVNYSNSARFLASILLVEGIYRRSILYTNSTVSQPTSVLSILHHFTHFIGGL